MAERFQRYFEEGDSVGLHGEITRIHDDGRVTIRVHGFDYPITVRSEHVNLTAKHRAQRRSKPLYDEH
jgi:hypothetical protein